MFGSFSFGSVQFASVVAGEVVVDREWPTLESEPTWKGFKWEKVADPNVQGISGSSFILRSGRSPIYTQVSIPYPLLTENDMDLLEAFQKDTIHYEALDFLWTFPITDEQYRMRLAAPMVFRAIRHAVIYYSTVVTMYGKLVV